MAKLTELEQIEQIDWEMNDSSFEMEGMKIKLLKEIAKQLCMIKDNLTRLGEKS